MAFAQPPEEGVCHRCMGEVFRNVCFALGQTGEVACGGVELDGDEVAFFGGCEAAGRREKDVAGGGCSDFCSTGSVLAAFHDV